MNVKKWKALYPDAETYYDAFHELKLGKETWQLAFNALNEDWDEEGDEEDPLIVAHDIVMDGLEGWLINSVEEKEWKKANEWFETLSEELSESVFAGLT